MELVIYIINSVLINNKKALPSKIDNNTNLRFIGFDSLDLAELTVKIEIEFGVDVFEDGIVETVGEILEKLGNK